MESEGSCNRNSQSCLFLLIYQTEMMALFNIGTREACTLHSRCRRDPERSTKQPAKL